MERWILAHRKITATRLVRRVRNVGRTFSSDLEVTIMLSRLRGIFRRSGLGSGEEFNGSIGIVLLYLQPETTNRDPGQHASHIVVEKNGLDAGFI